MRATKLRKISPEVTDLESDPADPTPIKTGLESDGSVSDLTDLSSDHEDDLHEDDPASTESNDGDGNTCNGDALEDGKEGDTKSDDDPKEFVEWEMV
jgi:hypothetical protein